MKGCDNWEVPDNEKEANGTSVLPWEEQRGEERQPSLRVVFRNLINSQETWFQASRWEACLTNPIGIFVEMMGASDEGRAACFVCLDLSKFFRVARLERYGLNRQNKGLCSIIPCPANSQLPVIPQRCQHYVFISCSVGLCRKKWSQTWSWTLTRWKAMNDTSCSKGMSSYSLGNIFSLWRWLKNGKESWRGCGISILKKIQNMTGFDPEEPNITLMLILTLLAVLWSGSCRRSPTKIPTNQNYSVRILIHFHFISQL